MLVSTPFRKKKHCPSHTDLNQIGPYSPSTLACSPHVQPPKIRAINYLVLDGKLCSTISELYVRRPLDPISPIERLYL
jgi:hypothetical protein